ncbi:NAD(P)H-binding protein [Kribbella speibonae]|uniref:NmrA family transcriptional regulator n=1 Tax=Kribbella speibonae TaxID=1572660 RepID=A0A4V2M5L9_9ACTN|nr:NAD(P)H-binding protein [Kribbella speibonae]TCC40252.1 NmrA family transcriptional regulator [Kribbella speibonae]
MLLITGATGHVGRALVGELGRRGAEFRALVRSARPDLPAEQVVGDLGGPLDLRGVDKVFLLVPGTGLEHTANLVAAARRAGVRQIVYLSSYAVLGDPIPAMGRWHHERERLIADSGIAATFLRPTGFMTNTLDWLPTIRAGGYVLDPIGPGRMAPIDPADIAAVAATVLTEDGHGNQAYTLTGSEAFTVAEQVAILGAAIGRALDVRPIATPEEAVRFRYPEGAPAELAAALIEGLTLMRADTIGLRTDVVRRLTGRSPNTFSAWCTENAGQLSEERCPAS